MRSKSVAAANGTLWESATTGWGGIVAVTTFFAHFLSQFLKPCGLEGVVGDVMVWLCKWMLFQMLVVVVVMFCYSEFFIVGIQPVA